MLRPSCYCLLEFRVVSFEFFEVRGRQWVKEARWFPCSRHAEPFEYFFDYSGVRPGCRKHFLMQVRVVLGREDFRYGGFF